MERIVYGLGLLIAGVCGMSGIGITGQLQSAAFGDMNWFEKILNSFLSLPFAFFFVLFIIGFVISTKSYLKETDDGEDKEGPFSKAAKSAAGKKENL